MNEERRHIDQLIFRFGKRKRLYQLLGSSGLFALLLLVMWLSIGLADQIFYFSRVTRWGLLLINLPLLLFIFYRFVLKPYKHWLDLKPGSDLTPTAAAMGRLFPDLKDTLINIYQLSQEHDSDGTSEDLRKAAVRTLRKKTEGLDFLAKLRLKRHLPGLKLALPVLLSSAVILGMRGPEMMRSTMRLLNPTNDYLVMPEFRFSVIPGFSEVIKNESITVKAEYTGPEIEYCTIDLFSNDEFVRSIRMDRQEHEFEATIPDIKDVIQYRVQGHPLFKKQLTGLLVSDTYRIDVLVPPRLSSIDLRLTPPSYSQLAPVQLERNVGDVSALPGTRIELRAIADKPVVKAWIDFESQAAESLRVRGEQLSGTFSVRSEDVYRINIIDNEKLSNTDPIAYTINLLPDRRPIVDIVSPGQDVESPLDISMQIQVQATDDFGIGKMYMMYRYVRGQGEENDSTWYREPMTNVSSTPRQAEAYHIFNFDRMPIAFDDAVKYYAVAYDNNTVTGPGRGESAVYYIRFPSITEMLDSFAEREEEETEKMDEVASESENIRKQLEEINRDLKREKKLDWETRQQIEETVEKQQQLQQKLENIQQELQEMVEKLEQNNLISEEVMEKYMQIQELFREIASPELLEAMKNLQKSLENPDARQVQRALERFKQNQEAFKENVERTLELLKQVQLEQKVDQLVKQAEQLIDQQQKISEAIEKQDTGEAEQLSRQQDQQKSVLDHMERNLENLTTEPRLQKFKQAAESLENVKNQMQQSQLSEQMQSLSGDLQKSDWNTSGQKSEQVQQQLENMRNQLSQAQQQLQMQHKNQVQKEMLSALKKVLDLSFEQENVQAKTKSASRFSDDVQKMNQKQGELMENFQKVLSSMIKLSRETFFLDPKLNAALSKTQKGMAESLNDLRERRNAQASKHQTQAMQGLNEAAQGLQNSLSQLSASSSGTGFEQFMEQMQKMAGMQGQVNEGTMNLFPGQGNPGQLSAGQQGEMRRLAAQQRAVQQAMEELSGKMGNRDDVLGRLGELGGEMEEVVEDLLNMNVDRRTIERQRNILSRMLDAQKSVREREFSKKRKAERAKEYIARDPGELDNPEDAEIQAIQEALKQALKEGYGPDYQKLIEAYFKALTEDQNAGSP